MGTAKKQILIVDDDESMKETLSTAVEFRGYTALTAGNGREALAVLSQKPVDLIISDVQMPEMTGIELFNQVKSKNIPVVLMTGFAHELNVDKAKEMGAADFIGKPFSGPELIETITSVFTRLSQGTTDADFCRVFIDDFISGVKTGQDVFLRLGENHFLRISKADTPLTADRIAAYRRKGVKHLYIRKEQFADYVGFNLKIVKSLATNKNAVPPAQKLKLVRQTTDLYLENLMTNGIDPESLATGKVVVETTLQLMVEADDLFKMIEALKQHSDSTYSHSVATSMYAMMIARAVGWTSASSMFKITMAAMLHDIGKKEIPKEILAKSREQMTADEVQLYESHPVRSKALLGKMPYVPEDVLSAVAQHHETLDGQGYPYKLHSLKIHPIAKLIAVADEFAEMTLKSETGVGLSPKEALQRIWTLRENELDPRFMKVLMEIFRFPVPDKIKNLKTFGSEGRV